MRLVLKALLLFSFAQFLFIYIFVVIICNFFSFFGFCIFCVYFTFTCNADLYISCVVMLFFLILNKD